MGYDWKGWAVLFYVFGSAFLLFGASGPEYWGLSAVQYHWLLFALGILSGIGAKFGASWAGKTPTTVTFPLDKGESK